MADHASTWLRNVKELEVMVAELITQLLSRLNLTLYTNTTATPMGCQVGQLVHLKTFLECDLLLHQGTLEEDLVRMVTPLDQYLEHFECYITTCWSSRTELAYPLYTRWWAANL